MKLTIILFLFLVFIGCNDNKQKADITMDTTGTVTPTITIKEEKKQIGEYMSDNRYFHWSAKHADTTQYLCRVTFHNSYAIIEYHGQCQYTYYIEKTGLNTIDLQWSHKKDCILNLFFLEKANGVKKTPKIDDIFANYTLINDTTLEVKYCFPEWIKKVNEIANDSIFPEYLYLDKDSY